MSIIVLAILGAIAARKRREALSELAACLDLDFDPEGNLDLADRFEFLDQVDQCSNRYAFNTIKGLYKDYRVLAFDYHYETHSTGSKGDPFDSASEFRADFPDSPRRL